MWPWDKLCNDFFAISKLHSATLRTKFVEAGIIELGHLPKASMEALGCFTDIRSSGMLRRIVDEVWQSLSVPLRVIAVNRALVDKWNDENKFFPSLLFGSGKRRIEGIFLCKHQCWAISAVVGRGSSITVMLNLRCLAEIKESG